MPCCSSNRNPSDYTFPIRGLETDPDPYTFHITLSQPLPPIALSDGDALYHALSA